MTVGAIVGEMKILRFMLAGEFWAPWAKLSFMCYIIHIFVLTLFMGQMKKSNFISHTNVIWTFFGAAVFTFMFSIVATLVVEAPWMHLEKLFLFP